MEARRKYGRRRNHRKWGWLRIPPVAFAFVSAALLVVLGAAWVVPRLAPVVPSDDPESQDVVEWTGTPETHRVYPYSVIPGGVRRAEDLQAAIQSDPIVAAHYAGVDARNVRHVPAAYEHFVHVSYRVGDEVFWTKKKHRIPKGEWLLTDGANQARSRCGNRLSEVAKGPVRENEPGEAVLSAPVVLPPEIAVPLPGFRLPEDFTAPYRPLEDPRSANLAQTHFPFIDYPALQPGPGNPGGAPGGSVLLVPNPGGGFISGAIVPGAPGAPGASGADPPVAPNPEPVIPPPSMVEPGTAPRTPIARPIGPPAGPWLPPHTPPGGPEQPTADPPVNPPRTPVNPTQPPENPPQLPGNPPQAPVDPPPAPLDLPPQPPANPPRPPANPPTPPANPPRPPANPPQPRADLPQPPENPPELIEPVPEPSTWVLLGSALAVLAAARRRK